MAQVPGARTDRPPTIRGATAETIAVAAASAFAGAALLSQTVVVPSWRATPPAEFLRHFPRYGPATGLTVFPFEVAAMLSLGVATWRAWRQRRPGKSAWAAATAGMAGTFVLLVYFVPANLALLGATYHPGSVPGALATWNRWNWLRTGLGLASACVAAAALRTGRAARVTAR